MKTILPYHFPLISTKNWKSLLVLIFLFKSFLGKSQDSLQIYQIEISGNKKTKEQIIRRELGFKENDKISFQDTAKIDSICSNKIFNTNLFILVNFDFVAIDSVNFKVKIQVKERWYIFPIPIFELADRNFNEWWNQRNRDINRIEWGIRIKHDNFRGRNEKLKIIVQSGFTKKYEIFHEIPYINKKKTIGLSYGGSYSTNKSVGYKQENNKLVFFDSEDILRQRAYSEVGLSFRPRFYDFHSISFGIYRNQINDTLKKLSNNYIITNGLLQRFGKLYYAYDRNKTDINYYPLKGQRFKFFLTHSGLGLRKDMFYSEIGMDYSKYFNITKTIFTAHELELKSSFPIFQPYLQQYGLGYGESFVRGYQAYIIDGQHFVLSRNEIKFKLWSFTAKIDKVMKVDQFDTVPYAIYLKLFSDWGYVWNQNPNLKNALSNSIQTGLGTGLDIVTFYDSVIRLEFSYNRLSEFGFNIHMAKAI